MTTFLARPIAVCRAALLALSCAGALAACLQGTPRPVRLGPPVESGSLGVGDVIEVLVYDEPAMSKTYKVAPDGTIDFPFAGVLDCEGKEPQEIGRALKARLREGKILKNPQVSVLVKEVNSKKVAVFGQVQKPGQFALAEGMTVTHAISMAGGFTSMADRDRITLTRRLSKDKMVRVVFSVAAITEGKIPDVALQAGDTIYVEESWA